MATYAEPLARHPRAEEHEDPRERLMPNERNGHGGDA